MESQVEEIKAHINIVEVVGGYVRLVKAGAHWKAPCPFHNEKTPSFMVNEERQIWHCFGCQKGGDVFSFLMDIEGIEFREALALLAERAGIELRRGSDRGGYAVAETGATKRRQYDILEWATKWYEKQLWAPVGQRSLDYLRGRGLTDETIRQFRIGYVPRGWRHVLDFLMSKGYTAEEIEATGLIIKKNSERESHSPSVTNGPHFRASVPIPNAGQTGFSSRFYDRFRERITFPIQDILGRVIGFSARVEPGGDESQAKYINTPETALYHKSQALYGIALAKQAIKAQDSALFVEGQMDVIATHQAGMSNTVAVSGTALTEEQLKIIGRYTKHLKLFFDMDGAGQKAARRSTEIALALGMPVEIVTIAGAGAKDAAELAQTDPESLRQAVAGALPALQYFLDQLCVRFNARDPLGRTSIIEEYTPLLQVLVDPLERSYWLKRLAEAVDSEERVVAEVVERIRRTHQAPVPSASVGAPAPVRTQVPVGLTRRSEVLRQRIILCRIIDPEHGQQVIAQAPASVQDFLRMDEDYVMLEQAQQAGHGDISRIIALASDIQRRERLIALAFEGEQLLEQEGLASVRPEERTEPLERLVRVYVQELTKELHREQLQSLERQMVAARAAGDTARETELRQTFAQLLQGK